jgi:hypothetical protein
MPPEQAATIDPTEKNIYDPPDVFNPDLHPPPGEIDVLNIVEAGVDFKSTLSPDYTHFYKKPKFSNPPQVPIGKGISLNSYAGDAFCDGSVDSFCNRGAANKCLLPGHNDGRLGLLFDGVSGWIVMNIPDLKNGFIAIKFESWYPTGAAKKTVGWTTINNERRRELSSINSPSDRNNTLAIHPVPASNQSLTTSNQRNRRQLRGAVLPEFCDEFKFEYALDGKVTSFARDEFFATKHKVVQRVVETVTILKDPNYTGGQEKEVEFAVRITGCAQARTWHLTHIYWS